MGINHSSNHKKKASGGRKRLHCKKRNHAKGRAPSNTKLSTTRAVKDVRTRGGNIKKRALRLNSGNFSLKSFNITGNYEIKNIIYHPSNNELVRQNMLTKSVVVKLDSQLLKKNLTPQILKQIQEKDSHFYDNLQVGNLLGRVCSRPGQVGTVDGYVLEGDELKFYEQKVMKKKSKKDKGLKVEEVLA